MLRILACLICVAASAFALVVGEAGRITSLAQNRVHAAVQLNDAIAVAQLKRVRARLTENWAQPTSWHAGALETLSWIDALIAARTRNDTAFMASSRDAAVQLVRVSPVQPAAWARLGALSELGAANPLCTAKACLEMSWHTAPLLPSNLACQRLQIARTIGVPISSGRDQRVRAYLVTEPRTRDAFQCLKWLPARARFEAFLFDRALRAKRRAEQRYE